MKTGEVPQDLRYFKDTITRDVNYALDENGHYTRVISDGWDVKNDALAMIWENILEECEPVRQRVLAKELSPIAYHMKKNLLNVGMLSGYAGIPKRKVKKHLQYEEFMKLDEATLQKYADAMRITVDELKKVN
jgi:hypothetical protein